MIKASHLLLAIFGFGALFSYVPIPGAIIVVSNGIVWNLLRCWLQDVGIYGLDFWFNKSTTNSFFTIPFYSVVPYIALMTVPVFQMGIQPLLGCVPFTYTWISSFLITIPSLFGLIDNTVMRIIFFKSIDEPWYEYLITRKPRNWKQCLRDELWNNPFHHSGFWGISELIGDDDANHAAHIASYRACYLPLDKIETWLLAKKELFLLSPPLWMTVDWFNHLPPKIKENVWKEQGELEVLVKKVAEVTQKENDEVQNVLPT